MGLRSESYPSNKGVCPDRAEGGVVVTLMEGVMLMDGLARAANALIAGWMCCVGG